MRDLISVVSFVLAAGALLASWGLFTANTLPTVALIAGIAGVVLMVVAVALEAVQ
jgi:hypothetical protein